MRIHLPEYTKHYNLIPFKTEEELSAYNATFGISRDAIDLDNYVLYWGNKDYSPHICKKYGVMETGFFHNASFIDTVGNYQGASLNFKQAYDMIRDFDLNGRKSAKDIIFNLPVNQQSKFNANHSDPDKINHTWDKIVLALQNPSDRSILSTTNIKGYYEFVESCCKFYGKDLFVKMHPWNNGEVYDTLKKISERYGCECGKAPMKIIDNCQFVITYNSTMVVDCNIRSVPVVQYGMGTFWNTFGVNYSNQTFPTDVKNIDPDQNLSNFLIYRYCYKKDMDRDKFIKMVNHFSKSSELFPQNEEFCYANNI